MPNFFEPHANTTDPSISNLTVEANWLEQYQKREKWKDLLRCCNVGTDISNLWVSLESLSKPGKENESHSVTLNDVIMTDPKRCPRYYNRQFVEHPKSDRTNRKVLDVFSSRTNFSTCY